MAQPLDSLVLTSSGYAQISDITAGTKVLTRYGEPAEVTDIFRKKLDVYKISLNDGSCFRVSSTHKNVVYTLKENTKREYTLETLELKDLVDNHTDDKFYVEVTHFDTLESQDDDLFKLDPELLGVLLSSTIAIHESTITISIPLNRLMHVARLFGIIGCSLVVNPDVVRLRPAACCDITSEDLIECLRKATVGPIGNFPLKLNYKILYQPYEYRDKFLAGYMSVRSNQNNQVIFRNQLVDSTVFSTLVRSLGYVDHVKAIKSNDRFTTYIHNVDFQCSEGRYITSIELEGQEDCIAITVDDPDHTYITDFMIPTHNADNLAAKYRPATFEDIVEQKVIVDIVKNICNSSEISNRNFLFIGPAGTGKTTTARIIANVLNHEQGEPIEIDGASHGNVESIREIISQARTYPIGCDWKIFIIDECFSGDTLIRTTSGIKSIRNVSPGDVVYNLTGAGEVKKVFKNLVRKDRLVCLTVNGSNIITTKDHLFFTDDGWVEAQYLQKGEILYDYKNMQTLRKTLPTARIIDRSILQQNLQICLPEFKNEREALCRIVTEMSNMWERILENSLIECKDVRYEVFHRVQEIVSEYSEIERGTFKTLAYIYMSCVWEADGNQEQRPSDCVLSKVWEYTAQSNTSSHLPSTCEEGLRMVRDFVSSCLCRSCQKDMQQKVPNSTDSLQKLYQTSVYIHEDVAEDEVRQPELKTRSSSQNTANSETEEFISAEKCYEMWQWILFCTSDSFETGAWQRMGVRVCNSDASIEGQPSTLSYELQSRPCLTTSAFSNRGRWDRPLCECSTIVRRKEGFVSKISRVDDIQSYKPGSNDELFSHHFADSEVCDDEYVVMYDLEVDGHPSYFAENMLVHNCHAISTAAWQSLLLTLESQPAKSIFMLCTTNPEKIPATIISRVQTFQLSKISLEGIFNRLKYIIEQENKEGRNITYTDDALLYIAKLAQGGMRDAITLTDKTLAYSTNITMEVLQEALGLPNYNKYFDMLNAIAKKDNKVIIEIINEVYNSGINFVKWFEGFFGFVTNIVKYIYLQDINQTTIPSTYQDKIKGYGPAHSAICLRLSGLLTKMNQELKSTQYLQEVAISYLCNTK